MGFLSKLTNWATGNEDSYTHENEIYEKIMQELSSLNQVLEQLTTYQNLINSSDIIEERKSRVMDIQCEITITQKQIANTEEKNKAQQLIALYHQLQTLYIQVIEEIKNELLQQQRNPDIGRHILEINTQIFRNVTFPPFQEYAKERTLNNHWTMDRLYQLQNSIAKRQAEIMPKISKYGR